MKKKLNGMELWLHSLKRLLLVMKITVFIVCFTIFQVAASGYSQNTHLNLRMKKASIESIFKVIEEQSEYTFFYQDEHLKDNVIENLNVSNKSVEEVLREVLKSTDLSFKLVDKHIIVYEKKGAVAKAIAVQQNVEVTGTVTDEKGESLPGVSVIVKGTTVGVTTDFDGNYTLSMPADAKVLVFSFVGMKSQEIALNGQSTVNVVLRADAIGLEEVVAVGYGVMKKSSLTGAVASVSGEDLERRVVTNVSNALQGAVAGVTVTRSSGQPGAGNTIRVRGITTIEGTNDPLILVDDIPVSNINDINPDDIASYSVLKDAASAAIYGSRAAAGVILITTKRAKNGEFNMDYNVDFSFNVPTETLDYVNAPRYFEMWNEKVWNDNGNGDNQYPAYEKDYIDNYLDNHAADPDNYPNTIWKDWLLKDYATTQRHNLVLSGGTERLKTKASFSYENQDALYAIRDWSRYTLRVNNDLKINDRLSANLDLAYNFTDEVTPVSFPLSDDLHRVPHSLALYEDGRIGFANRGNPYAILLYGGENNYETQKLNAKLGLTYSPAKNLTLKVSVAPSFNNYYRKNFTKQLPYYAADDHNNEQGPIGYFIRETELKETRNRTKAYTTQAVANYKFNIGGNNFDVTGGYEEYYHKYEDLKVKADKFILSDFPYMNHAPVDRLFWDDNSVVGEEAYRSVFGRLTYDYERKYLLQANFRYDGSSKFASEHRWGFFPSLSAGWVISEEPFFEPVKEFAEFLKLRASYGELGNDRLGNYLYISELSLGSRLFSDTNGQVISDQTSSLSELVMRDISWETTKSTNFGLDYTHFDNRLMLSFDIYQKKTTDMLLNLNIPKFTGYADPKTNVGDMKTNGWEFKVTWRDKIGAVGYSASFHISDSKTTVGDVKGKRLFSGNTVTEEGEEYRTYWGYLSDGIFQTQEEVDNAPVISTSTRPGDIRYKDVSGPDGVPDGKITAEDKVHLGGSLPRYNYGGSLNLDYKGFDLGIVFQGVGKQNREMNTGPVNGFQSNLLTPTTLYDGNYWSNYNTPEENLAAKYPRLTGNNQGLNGRFSDYWMMNGAYFRLKNITLGYTIPKSFSQRIGLSKLRVFVAGNDLFSIDNFPKGMDPEHGYSSYFITKSYIAGVKIKF
ncbi:SusC/RagA family TonB-linked outer membrane protein [Puteibacter caeruleilacunae]|nr:SusC/RagA family TonB-linked outer membrane protein [Puteibacter caeruleilacunae]